MPAITTAVTFSLAARIMVANCDLSPHSARKVIVKAWMKIRDNIVYNKFELLVLVAWPVSRLLAVESSSVSFNEIITCFSRILNLRIFFTKGPDHLGSCLAYPGRFLGSANSENFSCLSHVKHKTLPVCTKPGPR